MNARRMLLTGGGILLAILLLCPPWIIRSSRTGQLEYVGNWFYGQRIGWLSATEMPRVFWALYGVQLTWLLGTATAAALIARFQLSKRLRFILVFVLALSVFLGVNLLYVWAQWFNGVAVRAGLPFPFTNLKLHEGIWWPGLVGTLLVNVGFPLLIAGASVENDPSPDAVS